MTIAAPKARARAEPAPAPSPPVEILHASGPEDLARWGTAELRARLLVTGLFPGDAVRLVYSHVDRLILGGCRPVAGPVVFGGGAAIGTPHLLSDREMGIANLGGPGRVTVDGEAFEPDNRDVVYLGRGGGRIVLESRDAARPARFYLNSSAAQVRHPHRLIRRSEAKPLDLGAEQYANRRTLRMYVHPEVAPSALLLMGITDLAPGSVWNTMPCHIHERRMEAYLYFDLAEGARVFHICGRPDETRHLVVADGEAVVSPSWSVHMGAGTGPYAFVWGMTGENQQYGDVTPVAIADMR